MSIIFSARGALARVKDRPAIWGAVGANIAPILGVLFWGWSAAALMALYWLENLVIGGFNIARIGASGAAHGKVGLIASMALIPFFVFHYGLFCVVHGVFVLAFFAGPALSGAAALGAGPDPFALPAILTAMVGVHPGVLAGLWAIVAWQAIQFFVFYVAPGAFARIDPVSQMFAPYGRIIVLHLTLMGAGLVVLALGQPVIAVLLLAVLKTGLDVNHEARDRGIARARESWDRLEAFTSDAFKRPPTGAPPHE